MVLGLADAISRQWLDPANRTYALHGTNTLLDSPPSANTTLEDLVDLGYAGGEIVKMKDIMSNINGVFCYVYL